MVVMNRLFSSNNGGIMSLRKSLFSTMKTSVISVPMNLGQPSLGLDTAPKCVGVRILLAGVLKLLLQGID